MKKNQYGAVKVEGSQGAIAYQVQYNPDRSEDSPPTEDDLQIPKQEMPAIQETLKALKIQGKPGPEFLTQVDSYFEQNFRYSLKRSDSNQFATPLSAFLLENRSGHCEYFASATTLLLRGAGIPARYAVGYSVSEFSPLEKQYIVRSRHAHAWTMAYVNGTWQSLDTTPSDWTAQEETAASPLQTISDLWAFLSFKLASSNALGYVGWAIAPITAFFLWKWSGKLRIRRSTIPAIVVPKAIVPTIQEGLDSEFYPIEKKLDELNLNRIASESLQQWLIRLQDQLPESEFATLRSIINLHYRYRFDPLGIEPMEREKLRSLSQLWLNKFQPQ
jgi:protein-glutamine gamma-glutamyltransferase